MNLDELSEPCLFCRLLAPPALLRLASSGGKNENESKNPKWKRIKSCFYISEMVFGQRSIGEASPKAIVYVFNQAIVTALPLVERTLSASMRVMVMPPLILRPAVMNLEMGCALVQPLVLTAVLTMKRLVTFILWVFYFRRLVKLKLNCRKRSAQISRARLGQTRLLLLAQTMTLLLLMSLSAQPHLLAMSVVAMMRQRPTLPARIVNLARSPARIRKGQLAVMLQAILILMMSVQKLLWAWIYDRCGAP